MPTGLLSKIGIDCMLSKGSNGLRGDGCLYELSTSHPIILTPTRLRPGDYVKLRLWFPDENSFSVIELAEVQWVKNEWIQIDRHRTRIGYGNRALERGLSIGQTRRIAWGRKI